MKTESNLRESGWKLFLSFLSVYVLNISFSRIFNQHMRSKLKENSTRQPQSDQFRQEEDKTNADWDVLCKKKFICI